MEQGIVTNKSVEEVSVLWDGQGVYFKPGQQKVFPVNIAMEIAGEHDDLVYSAAEVAEIVAKEDVAEKVEAPVEYACKKCDFVTDSRGKLLNHAKSHKK